MVGVFWVSEALPLGATSLIPAAAFPLLGIMTAGEIAQYYMSPIVLLLLGGFLLSLAVEQTGAHQRLALHVLLSVGTSPQRLVLGFMVTAALMSMWISNTASALVMMPVALGVVDRAAAQTTGTALSSFTIALLLGTAYGASVGGMGTPVGTPPNLIAINAMTETFPDQPSFTFVTWSLSSLPVLFMVIPLSWYALVRLYPTVPRTMAFGAEEVLRGELQSRGEWTRAECRALLLFAVTAFLWITRADFQFGETFRVQGWASRLGLVGTHDGVVAVAMSVLAFALPSGRCDGKRLLTWDIAQRAPWDLVLLFGGGIALSKGFEATGVSEWLGGALAEVAQGSRLAFTALVTLAGTFGTEIMSNTALANVLLPVLASTAAEAKLDPRVLVWPTALACSCAFMMPAATGPNAIVFGTNRLRIIQMVRAGFVVNWLAWASILLVAMVMFPVLRGF